MPFHDSLRDAFGGGGNNGGFIPSIESSIPFVGSLIGIGASLGGAELSRQFAEEEASKQRTFVGDLSDTAFQRRVEDLTRAGLNPILAYQQGGASSPSTGLPSTPDYSGAITRGIEAGSGAQKRGADTALVKEQKKTTTSARHLNEQRFRESFVLTDLARFQRDAQMFRNVGLGAHAEAERQHLRFNKTRAGKEFHFYSQLGSAALKGADTFSKFLPRLRIPKGAPHVRSRQLRR